MSKYLVEILLPAAGQTFDVRIPENSMMYEVLELAAKALADLSGGTYRPSKDAVLCNRDTGMIYNVNLPISELGIRNGERMILI